MMDSHLKLSIIAWRYAGGHGISPVDLDLPIYEQQTLFSNQALADTEAAIVRASG